MSKKFRIPTLIGLAAIILSSFYLFGERLVLIKISSEPKNALAQISPSPEVCLVGHEAPKPREYKWELVKISDDPNCKYENGGLRCREPVNPDGTLGAKEILERICGGNPPVGICPIYTKGCSSFAVGPKTGKKVIRLQGLLEKNSAGYKFSPGNIIISKNPIKTEYVGKPVYPWALVGKETISAEKSMYLWRLSEADKKILAKVNKYLPVIIEKNLQGTEKHEEEHWNIMEKILPNYLNVINNLSLFSSGPFATTELAKKEIISSIVKRSIEERKKQNDFHKEWDNKDILGPDSEKKYRPGLIPDFDIECNFAKDYIFTVDASTVDWTTGKTKGVVEISPKLSGRHLFDLFKFWKDTLITLTAKPISDAKFKKWTTLNKTDYCPCEGKTNPVCKFILQKDVNCAAIFE